MSKLKMLVLSVFVAGCATQQTQQSQSPAAPVAVAKPAQATPGVTIVKSRDGKFDGEVVGKPAANSKFSKLVIGMRMQEVSSLIGAPDDLTRHETGKRWIPFYFGNDSQRLQTLYRGEGCLTYTGGNVFGGGDNELIKIVADVKGKCWED